MLNIPDIVTFINEWKILRKMFFPLIALTSSIVLIICWLYLSINNTIIIMIILLLFSIFSWFCTILILLNWLYNFYLKYFKKSTPTKSELKIIPKADIIKKPTTTITTNNKNVTIEKPLELSIIYANNENEPFLYLKYLPDTLNNRDRDIVILLLYGYAHINNLKNVPISYISKSFYQSISNSPGVNTIEKATSSIMNKNIYKNYSGIETIIKSSNDMYISKKENLSKGYGTYRLLPNGEEHATTLLKDLIDRA